LELAPYLKFYSTYANDFEAAVKLVERWTTKSKAFRTLLGNQVRFAGAFALVNLSRCDSSKLLHL
jgi:hypothetical protein